MGALGDDFKKMKDAARKHKDQVDDGLDKGADFTKEKTGGKYDDRIDQARSGASDYIGEDPEKGDERR